MITRLKMSRCWWGRGWRAPLVRVLCYVRRRRCAHVWRTARGARPAAYHVAMETGGTQSCGSWRAAFTAARVHVGAGR